MAKYITDKFYSNCLIEAIKAKVKDPFRIKIMYVPPKGNGIIGHFMWTDGEFDYDFGADVYPRQVILFKGGIRRRKLGFIQAWRRNS